MKTTKLNQPQKLYMFSIIAVSITLVLSEMHVPLKEINKYKAPYVRPLEAIVSLDVIT